MTITGLYLIRLSDNGHVNTPYIGEVLGHIPPMRGCGRCEQCRELRQQEYQTYKREMEGFE